MKEEGWGLPPLEPEGSGSLPLRIARALRSAILEGRFPPGSRLPSTRRLARALGRSRPVVVAAYRQLRAEGWLETRVGAGTFVSPRLPAAGDDEDAGTPAPSPAPPRLSEFATRLLGSGPTRWSRGGAPDADVTDMRAGAVDRTRFPWVAWRRCLARVARGAESWKGVYEHPAGPEELRELLAVYVRRQRGGRVDPEQVLVVTGSQQGLALVADVALDPGSVVALEHPFYPSVYRLFGAVGAEVRPVPVDSAGIDPDRLPPVDAGTRLLYLTPSHQFPTGCTLDIDRRLAVLEWAHEAGALVVEDDYDGELRYGGMPVPSLQGQDDEDRVVYVGSLSKILLPELRLGYLVVPRSMVEVFRRAKWERDRHTPRLDQLAAAEFVREGHLGRRVRRLRRRLSARRRTLAAELDRRFGDEAEIVGEEAGVHLMVRLPGLAAHEGPGVVERAARAGLLVSSALDCYLDPPAAAELLVGYGGPIGEEEIPAAVETLRRAWAGARS